MPVFAPVFTRRALFTSYSTRNVAFVPVFFSSFLSIEYSSNVSNRSHWHVKSEAVAARPLYMVPICEAAYGRSGCTGVPGVRRCRGEPEIGRGIALPGLGRGQDDPVDDVAYEDDQGGRGRGVRDAARQGRGVGHQYPPRGPRSALAYFKVIFSILIFSSVIPQ